jgi:hypothetical protein
MGADSPINDSLKEKGINRNSVPAKYLREECLPLGIGK